MRQVTPGAELKDKHVDSINWLFNPLTVVVGYNVLKEYVDKEAKTVRWNDYRTTQMAKFKSCDTIYIMIKRSIWNLLHSDSQTEVEPRKQMKPIPQGKYLLVKLLEGGSPTGRVDCCCGTSSHDFCCPSWCELIP